MHEVLANRLGGLSLPRNIVVRLTDRSDMTSAVYRNNKTTTIRTYTIGRAFGTLFDSVPLVSMLTNGTESNKVPNKEDLAPLTDYRKNSKIWDTSNNCHNCPKIGKV